MIPGYLRDAGFFIDLIFSHFLFLGFTNILAQKADLGILVCGTGIGISIRANRHKGIRAALLYSDEVAEMAKKHNNANVIVFGGRTMTPEDVRKRIEIFLNTEFEGGRHQKRLDMLDL